MVAHHLRQSETEILDSRISLQIANLSQTTWGTSISQGMLAGLFSLSASCTAKMDLERRQTPPLAQSLQE